MRLAEEIEARVEHELRKEMEAITDELRDRAQRDAPRLDPEAHARRHGGHPPLAETSYTRVGQAEGVTIGKVGFEAFYAAWQEERRDYKHDDGKAGYLGDNVKALIPEFRERLDAAVKRALS